MYRAVFLFILGLFVGACTQAAVVPLPPLLPPNHIEAAADLATKTVALVEPNDEGFMRAYCSGVWVAESSILTANHCIQEENNFHALYGVREDVFHPGSVKEDTRFVGRTALVTAFDVNHDLALLRTFQPVPFHGIAHVSLATIHAGQFAQTMGQSLGLWWSYSSGDVAAVRQRSVNDLDIVWIQSTTPISPGNSGGGLFDDMGQLIGIAHGTYTRGELLNVFVHAQYLDAFLRANP